MLMVALILGAVLGAIVRYSLARVSTHYRGRGEYGTLAANVIACFIAALVVHSFATEPTGSGWKHSFYLFALTGGAGALSTWSTLAGELVALAKQSKAKAAGYLSATLILGGTAAVIAFELPPIVQF